MTPSRPYLLRAFFDWLLDNDLTPHLVVNANIPHVMVPMQFVQDGQIVLNIAPRAVGQFHLTSSPTLALRVTGGGFPLLGDSCSRSTGFLLHRAA